MNPAVRAAVVHAACRRDWGKARGHLAQERGGRVLLFDREPELIRNSDGDVIGVDAWVRLLDEHGAEVPIDPHRRIINPPTIARSGDDPAAAFYEAVWDSITDTPAPEGWRTAGTVTTIYADTTDGRLEGQGATYTVARQGTGTINVDTAGVTSATGQFFSSTYSCYQQYFSFDTSAITDTDTISAVTFALWLINDVSTTDFTVEARFKDWGTSLTSADYTPGGSLSGQTLLATLATSGIGAAGSYKTFTSQAAFLTVAGLKTGAVRLFTSSSRQRLNNAPTGNEYCQFSQADTAGTAQDPRLTITHAGVTPAVRSNTFEGGTASSTVTTGNSGGTSGDPFNNIAGSPQYTSAQARDTLAVVNPNVDVDTHIDWVAVAQAGNVFCVRLYLYLVSAPAASQRVFVLLGASGIVSALWLFTDRTLNAYLGFSTSLAASMSTPVPTGQWVRVELRYTIDGSGNGTVETWLYTAADSSAHADTAVSGTLAWPGGKPESAEFHLQRDSGGYWYLDNLAVGPTKIGSADPEIVAPVGQPVENDTALPVTRRKRRSTGLAQSTEQALSIRAIKRRTVGQAVENDTSHQFTRTKRRTLGQAASTETALPAGRAHARVLGLAAEQESARPIVPLLGTPVGQAAETDQALPIRAVKIWHVGQAVENNSALQARPARTRLLGLAVELNQAPVLNRTKTRTLGLPVEQDSAPPFSSTTLGLAVEYDQALPIVPLLYRARRMSVLGPYTLWSASGPALRRSAIVSTPWGVTGPATRWAADGPHTRWAVAGPTS